MNMVEFIHCNICTRAFLSSIALSYECFSSCAAVVYNNSESRPVAGFRPHVVSMGVFGINLSTLYPNFGSLKEVFSIANQAIRL